jgi:hypothetical protein
MPVTLLTLVQESCRCCCMRYQGSDGNIYYVSRDKATVYTTPCHYPNPQVINGNFKIINHE